MECKDPDETDALSSRVLEYYRKYSQDKKLTTYFRGSIRDHIDKYDGNLNIPTVSIINVMEEVGQSSAMTPENGGQRPPLVGQDNQDTALDDTDNDGARAVSPTSSVTSNRKLEWDNGADIGYDNYHKHKCLQKSLSLPVLTSNQDLSKSFLRLSPEGNVTETSTQTNLKESISESSDVKMQVQSSSASSEYAENPGHAIESTSSSSFVTKPPEVSTDSECDSEVRNRVLGFLSEKVGLPVAESTPVYKLREASHTDREEDTPDSDSRSKIPLSSTNSKAALSANVIVTTSALSKISNSDASKSTVRKFGSITISESKNVPEAVSNSNDIISQQAGATQHDTVIKTKIAAFGNRKLKHFCITKPLTVECVNYAVESLDKVIQTTLTSNISVAVQTEHDYFECDRRSSEYIERQSVICFQHSDTEKEHNTRSLGTNTHSSTTGEDVSNSFEYFYGKQVCEIVDQPNSKLNKSQAFIGTFGSSSSSGGVDKTRSFENNFKRSLIKSNLTVVSPRSDKTISSNVVTASSNTTPLGNLIASRRSNVLIDKNVELLQKLAKSKKYDKVTKQYYIKKIIESMVNSSDGSTNSDIAFQNARPEEPINVFDAKEVKEFPHRSELDEKNLHGNLPWVPTPLHSRGFPQCGPSKKLEIRTFSAEILPEDVYQENVVRTSQLKKSSLFTLPNTKFPHHHDSNYLSHYKLPSSSGHSSVNDQYLQKFVLSQSDFSGGASEQSSKPESFKNWKEEKTRSERRMEQQQDYRNSGDAQLKSQSEKYRNKECGDLELTGRSESDVLLNFARKERENQINWINNEITHLNKLKNLLQKNDNSEHKVDVEILTKPRIADMQNLKKTASVYVITTERTSSPKSSQKHQKDVKKTGTGEKNSKKMTYGSNTYPPTLCKCVNPAAKYPSVCTNETCPKLNHRQALGPHVTHKDCKLCTDEACPALSSHLAASTKRKPLTAEEGFRVDYSDKSKFALDISSVGLSSELIKHARLISGEQYTHAGHPETCIRRYVFEIPVSLAKDSPTESDASKSVDQRMETKRDLTDLENAHELIGKKLFADKKDFSKLEKKNLVDEDSTEARKKGMTDTYHQDDQTILWGIIDKKAPCVSTGTDSQKLPHLSTRTDSQTLTEPLRELDKRRTNSRDHFTLAEYGRDQKKQTLSGTDSQTLTEPYAELGKPITDRKDSFSSTEYPGVIKTPAFGKTDSVILAQHDDKQLSDRIEQFRPSELAGITEESDHIIRSKIADGEQRDRLLKSTKPTPRIGAEVKQSSSEGVKSWMYRSQASWENELKTSDNDYKSSPKTSPKESISDKVTSERIDQKRDKGMQKEGQRSVSSQKVDLYDRGSDPRKEKGAKRGKSSNGAITKSSTRSAKRSVGRVINPSSDERRPPGDASYNLLSTASSSSQRQSESRVINPISDEKRPPGEASYNLLSTASSSNQQQSERTGPKGDVTRRKRTSIKKRLQKYSQSDRFDKTTYKTGTDERSDMAEEENDRFKEKNRMHRRKVPQDYSHDENENAKEKTDREESDAFEESAGKVVDKGKLASSSRDYSDYQVDDGKVKAEKDTAKKSTRNVAKSDKELKATQTTSSLVGEKKTAAYSSSSTSSSSQSESSSSPSSYEYICPCCKRNKSRASALVSSLQRDIQPLLCQPCYVQNQQSNWPHARPGYNYPGHVCNCYTVLKTETVHQIKRTVEELDNIGREQQFCTCSFGQNKRMQCSYCACKRKGRSKKAIAYTLTFEQGDQESEEEEAKKRRSLEEIKIKIPPPPHKKKDKDNENRRKKSRKERSPSHRKHHHHHRKRTKSTHLTLQEYLCVNKPNFIENAEDRRNCMIELAYMREERCQKYKQLLARTNGLPVQASDNNGFTSRRMFSSKEMKQITAQNYSKLPEVQQKLKDNRDKQVKKANRLLADMFNKKLQRNVLRGKHTLPTYTSVIQLI